MTQFAVNPETGKTDLVVTLSEDRIRHLAKRGLVISTETSMDCRKQVLSKFKNCSIFVLIRLKKGSFGF